MSDPQLRPAGLEDVAGVVALERELFGADAWSMPSVREELTGPLRRAVVAVGDAAVVGYAVVLAVGEVADLQRVAVAPSYRRQGLGGRLLEALDLAAYDRVLLEVRADDAAALGFYRQHGFAEVGRRRGYYRDGGDAVVMRRSPA